MSKKEFYKHRIKDGARQKMTAVLKYSQNAIAIVDNAICCITEVVPVNKYTVKEPVASKNYGNLFQIKVYNSRTDQEALILPDLLEELAFDDWKIIDLTH